MAKIFSLCMYFISFAPLWLSVAFIDIKSLVFNKEYVMTEKISLILIGIAFFSCVVIIVVWMRLSKGKEGGETGTVICAKENKLATIEFLLSYVLPLCAFNFAVWDGVVLFLLFFVIFGILNVKHNYFGMNIAFELMRFRLYECTIKNDDDVDVQRIVVSQRNLCNSIGDTVFLKSINNEYKINIS